MKSISPIIWVLCFSLFACGENEPAPNPCPEPEYEELKDNFSEVEFENAIIGTWTSAFEWEDNVNVMFLKIDCENNAEIILEGNGQIESYVGELTVEYHRPASPGNITLAILIITSEDDEIVLSDVSFGGNNMISAENLYLLNHSPPFATLEWGLD